MSLKIGQHPDVVTLMSYAAGSLCEPLAAAVGAHISMCPACRKDSADMELLGGVLITTAAELGRADGDVTVPSMPRAMAGAIAATPHTLHGSLSPSCSLPLTIAAHYGLSSQSIPWKRLGPGVWHHRLALAEGVEGDLRLLKIAAGRKMPAHSHGGAELTLVLEGAYSDETGSYHRGDMQDVDDDVEHSPIADPITGCVCLIASERPARFKGFIGRLMQPWTRM